MMPPSRVLGVEDEVLDPSRKLKLSVALQRDKRDGRDPWKTAAMMCTVTDGLACVYYLRGEAAKMREWADECVESVKYYLQGNWRGFALTDDGDVRPGWWFHERSKSVSWTDQFRDAICWAAILGRWEDVDTLSTFATADVKADLSGPIIRSWYVGLASWWIDRSQVEWMAEIESKSGSSNKDVRLRCQVLRAIADCDRDAASKALVAYLRFWMKRMKTSPQRLAKEATFLWYLAQKNGCEPSLPENLKIHIITVPDAGEAMRE